MINENSWAKLIIVHLMLLVFVTGLQANISGTVFRDVAVNGASLNTYGTRQSNELGVGGVTVLPTMQMALLAPLLRRLMVHGALQRQMMLGLSFQTGLST